MYLLVAASTIALPFALRSLQPTFARVKVVDVRAKVAELETTRGSDANTALFFHRDAQVSVHLHYMGRGHLCPLHVHPGGEEATVIVSGSADVAHRWGEAGEVATSTRRVHEGAVIASPSLCGHEWVNASADATLGNLVISMPPYETNVYVRPEDPRMLQGSAPATFEVDDAELAALARGGEAFRRRTLPMLGGKLSVAMVRSEVAIEPVAAASVVYVLQGSGSLVARRSAELGPSSLAVVPAGRAFELRATGAPLVALVLQP